MTDLRTLCARMADELDHYRQLLMDDRRATHALATEARAALAQPEPQGLPPRVGLILRLAEIIREVDNNHDKSATALAEAILSHPDCSYDSPAIEPVPVSERLPGPEDCDAEGRCWWWYPPRAGNAPTYGYWAHEDDATDRAHHEWPAAWLPHWALPVPAPTNTINQNNY